MIALFRQLLTKLERVITQDGFILDITTKLIYQKIFSFNLIQKMMDIYPLVNMANKDLFMVDMIIVNKDMKEIIRRCFQL